MILWTLFDDFLDGFGWFYVILPTAHAHSISVQAAVETWEGASGPLGEREKSSKLSQAVHRTNVSSFCREWDGVYELDTKSIERTTCPKQDLLPYAIRTFHI